ncbi:MAG: glycosyltransferase [Candidatus Omnitrophica bacterium]|nr:glycosyltransferase [Candidatus Omnitrophota bacterium]
MNILILTMLFPNSQEPAKAPFNLEIAKGLAKLANVVVIAPVRIPSLIKIRKIPFYENIEGICVFHPRIFLPPKIFIFLHGWIYYYAIKKWLDINREIEFDIILSPYLFPDGFAATLLAKYFKKKVVVEALGCDVNLLSKFFIRKRLIKYCCLLSDKVISVNEDMKEKLMLMGIPEEKIRVIYNGVDKNKFKVLDKNICREKLLLPLDKKIFLFVGNLEKVKGVHTLLEAWKEFISNSSSEYLLVIVGNGREKKNMERFIREENLTDSVRLVGIRPPLEIPEWMNACDIFCLPSIREGFPNVLLEALSCRKFIIASKVGGIPEIISSAEQGMLVTPSRPTELRKAFEDSLLKFSSDDRKIPRILSWDESSLERYEVFKELIESRT